MRPDPAACMSSGVLFIAEDSAVARSLSIVHKCIAKRTSSAIPFRNEKAFEK